MGSQRGRGTQRWFRAVAFAVPFLGVALVVPAPVTAAATGTIVVSGTVSCQSDPIEGVWVESGGGGSGWAGWQVVDGHTNIATYQAKIQNTSLPTNIRLHVGCGGSPSDWLSDNETGSTSQAGGALTGTATLNAVCNEVAGAVPDNQNCWFGYASAAAKWAIEHLSGPGDTNAQPADKLYEGNPAGMAWSGFCLVFADAAYWNSGLGNNVSPDVTGPTADAAGMYSAYQKAGLVHSAAEVPPVGALVFYPGLTSQGHIGISIGNGQIVSANESTPSVLSQGYDSNNLKGYYEGWAYPKTAFR
jgi:hypothetical protein